MLKRLRILHELDELGLAREMDGQDLDPFLIRFEQ